MALGHGFSGALKEAALILVLTTLAAVASNEFRQTKLPIFSSPEEALAELRANFPQVTLKEAIEKFWDGMAVFLDARSENEYMKGHIWGGLNLPWRYLYTNVSSLKTSIPVEAEIITYCEDMDSDLSTNLAVVLRESGFGNVKVFSAGISHWKQAGMPIEMGDGKSGA